MNLFDKYHSRIKLRHTIPICESQEIKADERKTQGDEVGWVGGYPLPVVNDSPFTEKREEIQKRLIKENIRKIRKTSPPVDEVHNGLTATHSVIVEPLPTVTPSWPPEVQSLVDWFTALEQPTEPFCLEAHRHIEEPVKFFSAIGREIESGPGGPRVKTGALQYDLQKLKVYLN